MTNEELYKAAKVAISELFGDTSVSRQETIENLRGLIGEIEIMIDALEHELREREDDV